MQSLEPFASLVGLKLARLKVSCWGDGFADCRTVSEAVRFVRQFRLRPRVRRSRAVHRHLTEIVRAKIINCEIKAIYLLTFTDHILSLMAIRMLKE